MKIEPQLLNTITEQEFSISKFVDKKTKDLFIKTTINGIMGVIVVVSAVVFGMQKMQPTPLSLCWAVLMLIGCFFRIFHAKVLYPASGSDESTIKNWRFQLYAYSFIVGLLWVSLPVLQPSIMNSLYSAYTVILLGIMTGGVYSLNRFLLAYALYTSPIAIFLVAFHFSHGSIDGKVLAILITAFFIAAFVYAVNTSKVYSEAYQLRTDNLNLIRKLQKQTTDLKFQKNKAELANQEKSKFLAAASHDLRQPLHALGFYLSALDNHMRTNKGTEILDKSQKNLTSLNDLLNSLIGISQLEAGDIDISPIHFKLDDALKPLIEEMDVIAEQSNIDLSLEFCDQVTFCDIVLLKRSLRNLIVNAIKHSNGSTIKVKVTDCSHKDFLKIQVIDNGKGIPNDQLDTIFKEFHQLKEDQGRQKGLGLGLTIVSKIAELQGHKITVESDKNGSIFSLSVPLGNKKFIVKVTKPHNHEPIQKVNNILVIDNEVDVLDSVALTLNSWGQNVVCATNEAEAIIALKSNNAPNIIISDYNLSDKETGVNVLNALMKYIHKSTQLIFVTGDVTKEKMQIIRATGHPALPKPLKPLMLKNVIKQLNKKPEVGRINLHNVNHKN